MEDLLSQEGGIINLIILFVLVALLLAISLVFIFTYSKKRILNEEVKRKALELKHKTELLHTTLLAQEEERKTIARDLHDDIGSTLNIINMNINKIVDGEEAEKPALEASKLTGRTIQNVRQLAHRLLPPVLEKFGLSAALKELFDDVETATTFNVSCEIQINEEQLSEEEQLNIFRITQELVSNSIKYSKAQHITFQFTSTAQGLYYSYQDDGVGFDESEAKKGLGMQNLENRVEMLNGTMKIKTEEGKGFGVLILTQH